MKCLPRAPVLAGWLGSEPPCRLLHVMRSGIPPQAGRMHPRMLHPKRMNGLLVLAPAPIPESAGPAAILQESCVNVPALISLSNQARAEAHARFTVAGEMPRNSEVSSMERPPK